MIQNYDVNSNIEEQITQIWSVDEWVNQSRVLSYWSLAENLSISIQNEVTDISLYPNPSSEIIHVKFQYPTSAPLQIIIYDVLGKQVNQLLIPKHTSVFKIPIRQQPQGVYLMHIKHQDTKQVYRIVKS